MLDLNKSIAFIASLFFFVSVHAGEAIIFDDASLIGFRDGNVLSGFYSQENEKFSCQFLFFKKDVSLKPADDDGYSDTKIFTFVPGNDSLLFLNRDKTFDIPGNLYRRENEWIIKTSSGQAGCENATGTFIFDRDDSGAVTYVARREIPAIGIRLVKSKSYFYDYRGNEFVIRKGYLAKWNGVVVMQTRNQFSYVRFADPRTNGTSQGRVTTGWIHTTDLVNPFPLTGRN